MHYISLFNELYFDFRIPDPVREDGYNGTSRRNSDRRRQHRNSSDSREDREHKPRNYSHRHGSDSSDSYRVYRDRHTSDTGTIQHGGSRSNVSSENNAHQHQKDYEERPIADRPRSDRSSSKDYDKHDRRKDSDSDRHRSERHYDKEGILYFYVLVITIFAQRAGFCLRTLTIGHWLSYFLLPIYRSRPTLSYIMLTV